MSFDLELLQKVKAETYITEYYFVSENTRYLRHVLSEKKRTENFEVWPNMWMFSFGQINPETVKVKVGGKSVELVGNIGVLIPARSPLTWIVEPKLFESEAIFSTGSFIDGFDIDHVYVFGFDQVIDPKSVIDLQLLLSSQHVRSVTSLPHAVSNIAGAMKHELDENHLRGQAMQTVAKNLSMSREAFARKFKQSFNVSPLAYQNRMKVSAAFEKLIFPDQPSKMTEVSFEAGFESFSSFNKQFKKFVKAAPSNYAVQVFHN